MYFRIRAGDWTAHLKVHKNMPADRTRALGTDVFFKEAQRFGEWCWVLLQGGAMHPHRVVFSRSEAAAWCSCVLRDKPCLHERAFVHWVGSTGFESVTAAGVLPEWVPLLAAGKLELSVRSDGHALEQAQKRRRDRLERAHRGLEALTLWLDDLGRRGLATVIAEEPEIFSQMAVRMSDASLVGLSRRLRLLASLERHPVAWPEQVMGELTLAWMAIRAFERRDSIPEPMLDDLERFLGISIRKEAVRSRGMHVQADWLVLGSQQATLEKGLEVRRTWLGSQSNGQFGVLVDYAYADLFPIGLSAGSTWSGSLVFYPSAFPLRAIMLDEGVSNKGGQIQMPAGLSVPNFRIEYAKALGQQPWISVFPGVLDGVQCVQTPSGAWLLVDEAGETLPLAGQDPWCWVLVSVGARERITVFGEWDGRAFTALSAYAEGVFYTRDGRSIP